MLGTDFSQTLEVAHRRWQYASGSSHWLHNHRGNGASIVQRHQSFQLLDQMGAPLRLTMTKGRMLQIVGMGQVVNAINKICAKHFAIGANSAHRDTAKVDAMVTPLTADQPGTTGIATGTMVTESNFKGSVDGLGTGVGEEGVIETFGGQIGEFVC